MKKRFLIVSPHPDDAELGTGGTIIKLTQAGHKVYLVDLTSGEPTPFGTDKRREKETLKSSAILNITARINLGFQNRYLFDSKEARLLLAEKIRLFKPDIIICPYFEDAHPDHIACTKITEGARFYAKYTRIKLRGKPHYPSHLFYFFCSHLRNIPQASFCVDISGQFKEKMKAVKCFRSQFIDNPNNTFVVDYIETLNRYLGTLIQCRYAEALYSKEIFKIKDLTCLL